jgi:2-polyprenyl-6-methoxyphenol hydroxylase-like FAD-dependent oxidoreductase
MKLHEMAFRRAPVLIVGGGPVGLYASVLLSRAGVPSVLLERAEHGPVHPRAHLINTRSMELLREVGLEGPVHALAPPLREWREFRYCHSLLGRQIAVEDHMAKPEWEILRAASPTRMTHVSQPGLEALLREEAERLAPAAGSKLLFGYECTVLDQVVGGGVQVQARRASADERTANGRPHSSAAQSSAEQAPTLALEGSALLACDGAHSRVRQALGLELKGNPPLQYFKSVHFRAPSLYERLKHRPAMLYFVFHQEAVAVLVAHHMGKGEWVAQLPFFPPLQDGSSLDEVECGRIIQALVGAPIDDLQV